MSKIHISQNGEDPIQYPQSEAEAMFRQGRIQEDAIYWKDGMSDWLPLRDLFPAAPPVTSAPPAELSPYAPPAVNPLPAPVAPPPGRYVFTQDPRGLTKALKVMLWFNVAALSLALLSSFAQLRLANGEVIAPEAAQANDARQTFLSFVVLGVFLATSVVFGKWIYRANLNCRGFGANGMQYTPGWAVGFYFVPILNFVRPFLAMREIWQVSSNPRQWQTEEVPPLLGWWWGLWIMRMIMGWISNSLFKAVDDVESLRTATQVTIAACVGEILLVVVAMTMVSRIIAMQVRLTEKV